MKVIPVLGDMTMKEIEEHLRTVTTKGQVTIPAEVRRMLKLKPRDKILFRITEGKVELQPVTTTLEDTFGAVTPKRRPEDFKKLRRIAIEEHAKKVVAEMKK